MVNRDVKWGAGASALAVVVTAIGIAVPSVAITLPVAIVGTVSLLISPRARVAVLIVGALLVFRSSASISPSKIAYLGVCMLSSGLALQSLGQIVNTAWGRAFRKTLVGALIFSFTLMLTFLTRQPEVLALNWVRDALPYMLIALSPLIAIDVGCNVPAKYLCKLLMIVAVATSVTSGITYASLRGGDAGGIASKVLNSGVPAALGFCFALLQVGFATRKRWWILASVAIPTAQLVSGNRSNLILIFGVIGVTGAAAKKRLPPLRVAAILVPVTAVLILVLPVLAARVTGNPDFLRNRIAAAGQVLSGHGQQDQSYVIRARSYAVAETEIKAHPLLGTGPGFLYDYASIQSQPDTAVAQSFTLDTPLVTVAKLGFVGTGALALYLVAIAGAVASVTRQVGPSLFRSACRGFAFIFVAAIPFGSYLEDKGLFIALILIVGISVAEAREATAPAAVVPPLAPGRRQRPALAVG